MQINFFRVLTFKIKFKSIFMVKKNLWKFVYLQIYIYMYI